MSVNRRAVHHFAITHVQDSMSVGGGFGIVSDHDDGLAEILVELTQEVQDGFGTFGVEVAGGLGGQDDFWVADNRASERHALLFAAGKYGSLVFEPATQAEQVSDDLEAMRIESISVDVLGQGDVVIRVESREQIETLKDETNFVAAQEGARRRAHR